MAMCLSLYVRDEKIRGLPIGSEESSKNLISILKTNVLEEIKQEITEGGVENWTITKNNEFDDAFEPKRKNDKILREFGW